MYNYIFMFMFISGFIVYSLKRKHLLLMLLSLEFISLSLFSILMLFLSNMNYEVYFSMLFLTMVVCEGVLGLSLLVAMIRVHGNDYIMTFSLLW
uniref:NADH-ubiquinone oxidoreductase chain 4L n=1 Tax=Rhizophagus dispar TaxID=346847 RepID=A0A343A3E8_RHIDI|nr:NADH dehydrogenase subunit 4L [Rhizophagus dispar]